MKVTFIVGGEAHHLMTCYKKTCALSASGNAWYILNSSTLFKGCNALQIHYSRLNYGRTRGMVLILVLWFVVIATLLASAVALDIRLSAKSAHHQRQASQDWAALLQGLHAAQMELMLERMPPDEEMAKVPLSERRDPRLQFDGRTLKTHYPAPEGMQVRIYDHAGKLNLERLSVPMLRDFFAKLLDSDDPRQIDALFDAWQDWKDTDDLKRLNGAEKDYYQQLDPPYLPRNANLESLDELLLIKGFADVLKNIDIDESFSFYSEFAGINPNLASPATLALLPGLDAAAVAEILAARGQDSLKNVDDLRERLTPEQLQKIRPWLHFSSGNFYTIALRPQEPAQEQNQDADSADPEESAQLWAYQMIVTLDRNYSAPPRILQVKPYARLPRDLRNLP
jgi:general secretion pathway protein K